MKKVLSRLLFSSVLFALSITPILAASPFPDVDLKHFAGPAVNELGQSDIVIGYPDGQFKGERQATRYEAALMVSRAVTELDKRLSTLIDAKIRPTLETLSSMKGDIGALQGAITDLNKVIQENSALKVRLDSVDERLASLGKTVNQIDVAQASRDAVAPLNKDLDALRAALDSLSEQLTNSLGSKADRTDIGNALERIGSIQSRLDILEAKVSEMAKADDLIDLKKQLEELKARTAPDILAKLMQDTITKELQTKGLNRNDIDSKIDNLVSDLSIRLNTLSDEIVVVDGKAKKLSDLYTSLETGLAQTNNKLDELYRANNSVGTSIESLKSDVSQIFDRLAALAADDVSTSKRLDFIEKSLKEQKAKLDAVYAGLPSENKTAIDNTEDRFKLIGDQITTLSNKLNSIESDLAKKINIEDGPFASEKTVEKLDEKVKENEMTISNILSGLRSQVDELVKRVGLNENVDRETSVALSSLSDRLSMVELSLKDGATSTLALRNTIEDIESQLKKISDEVAKNADLSSNMASIDEKLNALYKKTLDIDSVLANKVDKPKVPFATLEQIDKLKADLESAEAKNEQMSKDTEIGFSGIRSRLTEIEKGLITNSNKDDALNSAIGNVSLQLDKLSARVADVEKDVEKAVKSHEVMCDAKYARIDDVKEVRDIISAMDSLMKHEIEAINTDINGMKKVIGGNSSAISEAQNRIAGLEQTTKFLSDYIEGADGKYASLSDFNNLETLVEVMDSQTSEDLDELAARCDNTEQELGSFMEQTDKANKDIADRLLLNERDIKSQKDEISSLKLYISDLEKVSNGQKDEIEALKGQLASISAEAAAAKQEASDANKNLTELNAKVDALTEALKRLDSALETAKKDAKSASDLGFLSLVSNLIITPLFTD